MAGTYYQLMNRKLKHEVINHNERISEMQSLWTIGTLVICALISIICSICGIPEIGRMIGMVWLIAALALRPYLDTKKI